MGATMNARLTVFLLFTFGGSALSQTASLRGSVSDALNDSPLGGVSIVVDAKTSGVSGPDGSYLVPGLKRGAEIALTYDKGGYGKYSITVRVAGPRMTQDVALLRETADAAYWSSWSQKRLAASNQNGKAIVASAWREVEHGGLSAEAKSVAARSLLASAPGERDAPDSMLAAAGLTKEKKEIEAHREYDGAYRKAEVRTVTGCLWIGDDAKEFVLTSTDGSTWEVRSDKVSLPEHVGHMVTATGAVSHAKMHNMKEDAKEAAKDSGMKNDATQHGHLTITDVKMVSESCR